MAMSGRVILIQDFWRLFLTPSTSPKTSITLKDISKQVDFYLKQPSPLTEGYVAYDRGKVAVMGIHGVYILVLDSILDKLGEIRPPSRDTSSQIAQQTSSEHTESWPSVRLREVKLNDFDISKTALFLCLQLSETKLYFSVLQSELGGGRDQNMWCYDFASSPSFTSAPQPCHWK